MDTIYLALEIAQCFGIGIEPVAALSLFSLKTQTTGRRALKSQMRHTTDSRDWKECECTKE